LLGGPGVHVGKSVLDFARGCMVRPKAQLRAPCI
jgi:hypothetical protein